jgi:hypothetical protein
MVACCVRTACTVATDPKTAFKAQSRQCGWRCRSCTPCVRSAAWCHTSVFCRGHRRPTARVKYALPSKRVLAHPHTSRVLSSTPLAARAGMFHHHHHREEIINTGNGQVIVEEDRRGGFFGMGGRTEEVRRLGDDPRAAPGCHDGSSSHATGAGSCLRPRVLRAVAPSTSPPPRAPRSRHRSSSRTMACPCSSP